MTYIVLKKNSDGTVECREVETGKDVIFASGVEVPEEVGEVFTIE